MINLHYITDIVYGDIQNIPQDISEQKKKNNNTIIIENLSFGLKNVSYFIVIVGVFWPACSSHTLLKLFGTTGIFWLNTS